MEFVWVVPRAEIFGEVQVQGFLPLPEEELQSRFLDPLVAGGFFMERRYAETHSAYKQPIPYVVVQRGEQALCLTRLPTQQEERLHGLRSIGVGGHINPCDADPSRSGADLVSRACFRELHEELLLPPSELSLSPIGILNDDETEVGAVHLGIVYRLDANELDVAVRETGAMTGEFLPLTELEQAAASEAQPSFESWSGLLLRSGALAVGAPVSVF